MRNVPQYRKWTPAWFVHVLRDFAPGEICCGAINLMLGDHLLGSRHAVGIYHWPTKSYEAWITLQNLLYLIKPRTMVELGAGRSSHYLSEYAFKNDAAYVSFEQHLFYYWKLRRGLKAAFLPNHHIKYAPLKQDWYSPRRVRQYLRNFESIEFLFYDGPATPSGGSRNSAAFEEIIFPLLNQVKMVLVDDVHRELENRIAGKLCRRFRLHRYDLFSCSDDTRMAFLFNDAANAAMKQLHEPVQKLLQPPPEATGTEV